MHGKRIIFGGIGSGKTLRIQELVLECLAEDRHALLFCREEESLAIVAKAKALRGFSDTGAISKITLANASDILRFVGLTNNLFTSRLAIVTINPYEPALRSETIKTDLSNILQALDCEHRFASTPNKSKSSDHIMRDGKMKISDQDVARSASSAPRYHVYLDLDSTNFLGVESIELLPDNAIIACQSLSVLNELFGLKTSNYLVEGFRECEFFRCGDLMTAEKAAELSEGIIEPHEIMGLKVGSSRLVCRTVKHFNNIGPPPTRRTFGQIINGFLDRLVLGGAFALYHHDSRTKSDGATKYTKVGLAVVALAVATFFTYMWLIQAYPGSGFVIQRSDGLINSVPLGIEFKVRI